MVGMDVPADHRGSCVEKTRASGEPGAWKACMPWFGGGRLEKGRCKLGPRWPPILQRWLSGTLTGKVPQDLCATAKARPPESQSPLGASALLPEQRLITGTVVCCGLNRIPWQPSHDRRWLTRPFKGMSGAPTAHSDGRQRRTAGWPTAREGHGHGVLILLVGVTPHQGDRETRSQGEGAQVSAVNAQGGVRDAQSRPCQETSRISGSRHWKAQCHESGTLRLGRGRRKRPGVTETTTSRNL